MMVKSAHVVLDIPMLVPVFDTTTAFELIKHPDLLQQKGSFNDLFALQ